MNETAPTPTARIASALAPLLERALASRAPLFERLRGEDTDSYRIFHGASEGMPGLTIDRYGSLVIAQTFREPLSADGFVGLEGALREALADHAGKSGADFDFAYNHRGKRATEDFGQWHEPTPSALAERECRDLGARCLIRARHPGIDPWLFLDLRSGRRLLRADARGKSVLNLFSYTCSVGLAAAMGGASEVWNIDFAASNLEVGRRNAELNGIDPARFRTIRSDCLPALRQLAGLPAGGRFGKTRPIERFEAREFDWVFLDPPTWAKSAFGAVDIAGDYPTLFKPAVLIVKPQGGRILATNHLPSVDLEAWLDTLKRCAAKAGRPLRSIEVLEPDADFPSFDGRHPLKIAVCEV